MLFQFFYQKNTLSQKILNRTWHCQHSMTIILQPKIFLEIYCVVKKIWNYQFFVSQVYNWLGIFFFNWSGFGLTDLSGTLRHLSLVSWRLWGAGGYKMVSIVMTAVLQVFLTFPRQASLGIFSCFWWRSKRASSDARELFLPMESLITSIG